ncbi:MAG TPA: glycine cleavage system protein H [Verrucomicrobiales bacterium]|nr:glycine cleavage system protein H [Verrucomicrobiales bacterium]
MSNSRPETLFYKKSNFVAHLPVSHRYTAAHSWAAPTPGGTWRVGLTKFATRMLGELVDHGFEPASEAPVEVGQIIGWVEGFKAISDLYCIVRGQFVGGNPLLRDHLELLGREPFGSGWLYEVRGEPDSGCMDVHAYVQLLDKTIDRILEKQSGDPSV